MNKSHWRFFLLRWHRRTGVVVALFVLLLVITGILINHAHELGLDSSPLQNNWLRARYGLPAAAAGIAADGVQVHDGRLYVDGQFRAECARLVGVMEKEKAGQRLVVCPDRLLLLTSDGELIDQADNLRGIPSGLSAIGRQGDDILLKQGESIFGVDLMDLSLHPLAGSPEVVWQGDAEAGPAVVSGSVPGITWERVLLDLHSGRLFGRYGPWLVDVMALLFAALAISGLVLARRRHHHRW